MRHGKIKDEIVAALTLHPEGMTMADLAAHIGFPYESVRTSMQRNRAQGVYVAEWLYNPDGPHSALYKIVVTPRDAPKPRGKHSTARQEAVAERAFNRHTKAGEEKQRQERIAALPVSGLTQIRGNWPYHH